MKSGRQRSQTIVLKLINRAVWYSTHISIEVVNTTLANISDFHETDCTEDSGAISSEEELLLPNLHIHCKRGSTSWCVESLLITARYDCHGPRACEHSDNEYRVFHILPTIWTAFKIVSACVVRWHHSGVCSIAVELTKVDSVPINELISSDIRINRCSAGMKS